MTIIPHICMVKHDPPHSYGDCLRTAYASLLSIDDVEAVPHFLHDGNADAVDGRVAEWLLSKGYRQFATGLSGDTGLADIFAMMADVNRDVYYLLFCQCAGADHVVICRNDKVVHNPGWVRSPIDGPPQSSGGMWIIKVLVPAL